MRCQNTLVIIYAQKTLFSVSHPVFLLRKNPPFPQERAKICFAYRTPHPSRRQCVCVNVICTPPRHLLPLEKAFVCIKKRQGFRLAYSDCSVPEGAHHSHYTQKKTRQMPCLFYRNNYLLFNDFRYNT